MIVNLEQFVVEERPKWERLDALLRARARDPWRPLPLEEARELERLNRDRDNYCRHYTGRERGRAEFYDLCLDSSRTGIEGAIELIVDAVKRRAPAGR